jgi:toxin HigB-1
MPLHALPLLAPPGYRLHPLKGAQKGLWSITVSGNWRITFGFAGGNAVDVDLIDYHQEAPCR